MMLAFVHGTLTFSASKTRRHAHICMASTAGRVRYSAEERAAMQAALAGVRSRIAAAAPGGAAPATLIAVSKTKAASAIAAAYAAGQRDFGENYVQEMIGKAVELPADIRWHFIGALQSNKAAALLGVANLAAVHSVDRSKTARALQKAAERVGRERLDVYVQVNVDEEMSKSGCEATQALQIVEDVRQCDRLVLRGFMCIGRPGNTGAFVKLRSLRDEVTKALNLEKESLTLSMGMSADFEQAVAYGSNAVRVGSLIFGKRDYPAVNSA